jgi:hypothetical protein
VDKARRDRKLGAPPGDWKSEPARTTRASAETQRMRRADLGGPPPEFGSDERPALPATDEPFTALVVSEDREAAARIAFALAEARAAIRLALDVDDASGLLDGASAVFVVVPSMGHPASDLLARCRGPRSVVALVPDAQVAARVRGQADYVVEAPWDLAPVLRSLRGDVA